MIAYDVWCEICGTRFSEQDPEVTFHYDSHTWECTDEAMCLERKAMADLERSVDQ